MRNRPACGCWSRTTGPTDSRSPGSLHCWVKCRSSTAFTSKLVPRALSFGSAADGTTTVDPEAESAIVVPLSGIDPLTVYRVKATVTDASGRAVKPSGTWPGSFPCPRPARPWCWTASLTRLPGRAARWQYIHEGRQYRIISPATLHKVKWNGPGDLSAKVRFLWDDAYLYVGVDVTEHVFNNPMPDDMLWAQDGLQFIVDPARSEREKPGKYDYSMGLSHTSGKGKAWCHLSGNTATSTGEVKDIVVATRRAADGTGGMTYEIAIPWSRAGSLQTGRAAPTWA